MLTYWHFRQYNYDGASQEGTFTPEAISIAHVGVAHHILDFFEWDMECNASGEQICSEQ